MFTFLKNFFKRITGKSQDIQMTAVDSKVPAIPYDANGKNAYVPMIAIVDAGGQITGYLPLAAVDNGDGTASIKVTN